MQEPLQEKQENSQPAKEAASAESAPQPQLSSSKAPVQTPDFNSREYRPLTFLSRPAVWLVVASKRPEYTPTPVRTITGESVRIVRFVNSDDALSPLISVSEMRASLREFGFKEKPWWGNAEWGVYVRDDIGVEISRDSESSEHVGMLIVAFDLSRAARSRIPAWQDAVAELCKKFPLRLYDGTDHVFRDVGEFPAVIQNTGPWQIIFGEEPPAK